MTEATPSQPLKRLGFVQDTVKVASGLTGNVEKLYKSARSLTPAFVEPTVAKVEDTVVAYTAPVVAKSQDLGDKFLHGLDDQVDYFFQTAEQALSTGTKSVSHGLDSVRELHGNNLKTFSSASQKYFESITKLADYAADKLNPVKGVKTARDTLGVALEKAQQATDPDVAVQMAWDAWTAFASVPAVAKLLDTAEPATKLALTSFYSLHDKLVGNSFYKKSFDMGSSTLSWAIATTPYKLGAQYLYPLVQPIADPTLAKLSNSKQVNKLLDFWRPVAAV